MRSLSSALHSIELTSFNVVFVKTEKLPSPRLPAESMSTTSSAFSSFSSPGIIELIRGVGATMPVVLILGDSSSQPAEEDALCASAGYFGVLHAPVATSALLDMLRRVAGDDVSSPTLSGRSVDGSESDSNSTTSTRSGKRGLVVVEDEEQRSRRAADCAEQTRILLEASLVGRTTARKRHRAVTAMESNVSFPASALLSFQAKPVVPFVAPAAATSPSPSSIGFKRDEQADEYMPVAHQRILEQVHPQSPVQMVQSLSMSAHSSTASLARQEHMPVTHQRIIEQVHPQSPRQMVQTPPNGHSPTAHSPIASLVRPSIPLLIRRSSEELVLSPSLLDIQVRQVALETKLTQVDEDVRDYIEALRRSAEEARRLESNSPRSINASVPVMIDDNDDEEEEDEDE